MNIVDEISFEYKEFFNKKFIFFGASDFGIKVYNYLEKIKLENNILYFCDNDEKKWNKKVCGIKVISPKQLQDLCLDGITILVTSMYKDEIKSQLESIGVKESKYISFESLQVIFEDSKELVKNKHYIKELQNVLQDKYSLITLERLLKFIFTGDNDFLKDIIDNEQYFPEDIINLSEEEIFVDAGAFNGDTIKEFIKKTNGKFKKIYAFEPDNSNYIQVKKFINNFHLDEKIKLFKYGLYKSKSTIKFASNIGGCSRVIENFEVAREKLSIAGIHEIEFLTEIKTISLDEILNDKEVTFIKMDIEGAEMDALIGAKETILKNKPKLAICIYHDVLKHEDLWKIPLFIRNLNLEYKIYIRHHDGSGISETVCYAIPK